jgi:hypothetical protein
VGLVLDGCRAEATHPLPPAPSPGQVLRAMRADGAESRRSGWGALLDRLGDALRTPPGGSA